MPSLSEPPRSPVVGESGQLAPEWRQWFTRVWRAIAPSDFFYIPAATAAPTATPEVRAGFVPMVYETTSDKLWIYNGSSWVGVTLA